MAALHERFMFVAVLMGAVPLQPCSPWATVYIVLRPSLMSGHLGIHVAAGCVWYSLGTRGPAVSGSNTGTS